MVYGRCGCGANEAHATTAGGELLHVAKPQSGRLMDDEDTLFWEFLDPGIEYECLNCGTQFGNECIVWNEEAQRKVAICPGCGAETLIGGEG